MLSPGKYHEFVPRDPQANVRFRKALLERCKGDRAFQSAVMEACRQDVLFFVNSFVWQFNPNWLGMASNKVGPFITWEFQDEAVLKILACIEGRRDLVIEKSREMGASWLCLLVIAWMYLFHTREKFLVISRNEEAVDRPGDSDSLFWKLDYVFEHLPDWMMRCNRKDARAKKTFEHPYTRSSITGQATTGKAGVGGRATAMFIDEFSQIEQDFEVLRRTSDTTGCRIFNGTHKGTATAFFEICKKGFFRKLQMHWTQHPDKCKGLYRWDEAKNKVEILDKTYDFPPDFNFVRSPAPVGGPFPGVRSPWYDEQCERKGDSRAVAEDLDIDPGGSARQFFDPMQLRVVVAKSQDPWWEGYIDYDEETGRPLLGLYAQEGGPIKMWLNMKDGAIPKGKYVCGGDVSYGVKATHSCFSIADARTGSKVLEYSTNAKSPQDLAPLITALCWLFQDIYGQPAYLVWETPGPGIQFGQTVIDLGFTNIFYRYSNEALDGGKRSDIPGWNAQPKTKEKLLGEYRAALFSGKFINPSHAALLQCGPYRYAASGKGVEHPNDKGASDPTEAGYNHGDLVIGDALCWMLCRELDVMDEEKQLVQDGPPFGSLAYRRELRKDEEEWSDLD